MALVEAFAFTAYQFKYFISLVNPLTHISQNSGNTVHA